MADQSNIDVLVDTLDLKGKRVVDIGCGLGELVHQMAVMGAEALGVDPNPERIATAKAGAKGSEKFEEGKAEALPLTDGSVDIAIFFNSLHHVQPDRMDVALAEAARVLKPGGTLYLSEPVAEGSHFELMKPITDETSVRAIAYAAIRKFIDGGSVVEVNQTVNTRPRVIENFDKFCTGVVDDNPNRREILERKKEEVRTLFENHGRKVPGGYEFDRLTRINLLRKV